VVELVLVLELVPVLEPVLVLVPVLGLVLVLVPVLGLELVPGLELAGRKPPGRVVMSLLRLGRENHLVLIPSSFSINSSSS